jgi:hypothetical protein
MVAGPISCDAHSGWPGEKVCVSAYANHLNHADLAMANRAMLPVRLLAYGIKNLHGFATARRIVRKCESAEFVWQLTAGIAGNLYQRGSFVCSLMV